MTLQRYQSVKAARYPSFSGTDLELHSAAECIEWNSGLTAAFRNPAGHDRVLLFRDSDSLRRLAGESNLKDYKRLYAEALQGQPSADSPVVAIQPPGYIDIREDFYLYRFTASRMSTWAVRRHACCRFQAYHWPAMPAAAIPCPTR